jgi:hypothetical protein
MARSSGVRHLAATLFVTVVQREGLPRHEDDTRALSADCYRAAQLLLSRERPHRDRLAIRPKRKA